MPNILKATIWFFRYLIYKCSIKNHHDSNGLDNNDVCIISYLFNIDKESIDNNILQTRYWTKLHPLLAKNKKYEEFYSLMSEDALATILDIQVMLSNTLIRDTFEYCEDNMQVNGDIKKAS